MSLPYSRLNPNIQRTKGSGKAGMAPHKPLLLLCLCDLAEAGCFNDPIQNKSAELRLRFDSYWAICQPRWGGQPGLDLPFHYLSSQGFWKAKTKEGTPSLGPHSTHYILLNETLLSDFNDSHKRDLIRHTIISHGFPESEQSALFTAIGFTAARLRKLEFELPHSNPALEATGRDARFRVTVVTQYRFTCSLTGYGAHTSKGHSIVEAAHIHAFAKSRNNQPDNGLALSPDAHWMFDKGLWTSDDEHRVLVADEVFTEWGPDGEWLKARHGQPLRFAHGVQLRPARRNLAWHRSNVFNCM